MFSEIVLNSYDNDNRVQLQDDTATAGTYADSDLSGATKVELVLDDGTTYNSTDNPDELSFTAGGLVTIKLGLLGKTASTIKGYLVVYDVLHPNGIRWSTDIMFVLRAA